VTDLSGLGDRAKALAKLKGTDGWKTLGEIYTERRIAYQAKVGRDVLRRGYEINQREIDYNAGYFFGVQQLLDKPEQFEQQMEAALQKQRLQEQGDKK
jgi:hypothetical protein